MTTRLKPMRARIGKPTRINRQVDIDGFNDAENQDPMGDQHDEFQNDKLNNLDEQPTPTVRSHQLRTSSSLSQHHNTQRRSIANDPSQQQQQHDYQSFDNNEQKRSSQRKYRTNIDSILDGNETEQSQLPSSSSSSSSLQQQSMQQQPPNHILAQSKSQCRTQDENETVPTRSPSINQNEQRSMSSSRHPIAPPTPTIQHSQAQQHSTLQRNNSMNDHDDYQPPTPLTTSTPSTNQQRHSPQTQSSHSRSNPSQQSIPSSSTISQSSNTNLSSHRNHIHETGGLSSHRPSRSQQSHPPPHTPTLHNNSYQTPTLSNHKPQIPSTHQLQPTPIPSSQSSPSSSSTSVMSQTPILNPQGEMLYKKVKINQISYTILKTLGKGGSGKVYQAIRDDIGSMCAIKEIDLLADMNSESAIKDEISLLQKLSTSPRVIKLLDHQSRFDINIWYIVLELGSNDFGHILTQSLQEYKTNYQLQQQNAGLPITPIPHCGGLTITQLNHYWQQILSGVQTCHDINILHLDLKPANFVMVDGSMKLIDFGIAKAKNAEYTSVIQSNIMGTISYISPEQLSSIEQKGAKVRPSSDVWALGCIFHQMIFGYTPYAEHKQAFQRIAAISSPLPYTIPPIPTFITGGDNELEILITDVLKLCLQKDPKNRPTVQDLLQHPLLHPHSRKLDKYKHLFHTSLSSSTTNTNNNNNVDSTRVLTAMKNVMKEQMDLYKAKDVEKPNLLSKEFIALIAQGGNWKILAELLSTQLNTNIDPTSQQQ